MPGLVVAAECSNRLGSCDDATMTRAVSGVAVLVCVFLLVVWWRSR